MIGEELYIKATEEIDAAHSQDSMVETENGSSFPAELLYSKRMLSLLDLVIPNSPNTLKLAAQCQHLKRWSVPRADYPYDRRGYHQWRRVVMEYQLKETHQLLANVTMEEQDIHIIVDALKNQGDKSSTNGQILMDTSCLVFIKWYMESFAAKHEHEKVLDIMKKTLRKMSENGRKLIPKLNLPLTSSQILEISTN